jgi:hypothetical protein
MDNDCRLLIGHGGSFKVCKPHVFEEQKHKETLVNVAAKAKNSDYYRNDQSRVGEVVLSRRPHKSHVTGSNPVPATNKKRRCTTSLFILQ